MLCSVVVTIVADIFFVFLCVYIRVETVLVWNVSIRCVRAFDIERKCMFAVRRMSSVTEQNNNKILVPTNT